MKTTHRRSGRTTRLRVVALASTVLAAAWFGLAGNASADAIKDPPRWTSGKDFSSVKDWYLKAENIVPHGVNPLYFPIVPGHKHIHERPDHPDGKYRKETVVLNDTEEFDLTGIGKFKTAVVQEEEYMDGVLMQRALNWFALDKTTNNVYAFGEISWEIDDGKPVFGGTWRAGEVDGDGVAEPGLLMPGTFTLGARYIFDGSQSEAYGGSENMEAGVEITVPAGTFKDCVRVREQGLNNLQDITDKVWCPIVGVVYDTSVSSVGTLLQKPLPYTPPVAKVSGERATQIALGAIPGKATSLKIERKRGKNVYTVEIMTKDQGEKDVFVDIESGDIVGTD
jgi:hypothetical protein